MTTDEIEVEALKLRPEERARLAVRLLESLENLSDHENAQLLAEEAVRRDKALDAGATMGRPAADVFRDARSRLK
jgi:hypothetical protein